MCIDDEGNLVEKTSLTKLVKCVIPEVNPEEFC